MYSSASISFLQRSTCFGTRYLSELGRYNYVTPTSYLQLLHTYMVILQKKRE